MMVVVFSAILTVLIAYPYYKVYEAPWHEMVLRVNDTVLDMRDYIRTYRLYAGPQDSGSFEVSLQVLEEMQFRELIKQTAPKRNIRVIEQEVSEEIKRRLSDSGSDEREFAKRYEGFLRNTGVSDREYREWIRTDLLRDKLREQLGQELPTEAEQVRVHAIRVADWQTAEEIRQHLLAGGDFGKWARKETTDHRFKANGGDMGWQIRGIIDTEVIEQVRALGILTKTQGAADQARARIEAGESFAKVAKDLSEDEASRLRGGDLGWLAKGKCPLPFCDDSIFDLEPAAISKPIESSDGYGLVKILEKAPKGKLIDDIAFSLPIGHLSPPLFTGDAYYLIKVSEKASNRAIDPGQMGILRTKALNRWLGETSNKGIEQGWIQWHWDSFKYAWTMEQLKQ